MGQWTKSLPEPTVITGWRDDRAASALDDIAFAMVYLTMGHKAKALRAVRMAAAEVRAWRKSLPEDEQGLAVHNVTSVDLRRHLTRSVARVVEAAEDPDAAGLELRWAEAHLRAVGKALAKEVEK